MWLHRDRVRPSQRRARGARRKRSGRSASRGGRRWRRRAALDRGLDDRRDAPFAPGAAHRPLVPPPRCRLGSRTRRADAGAQGRIRRDRPGRWRTGERGHRTRTLMAGRTDTTRCGGRRGRDRRGHTPDRGRHRRLANGRPHRRRRRCLAPRPPRDTDAQARGGCSWAMPRDSSIHSPARACTARSSQLSWRPQPSTPTSAGTDEPSTHTSEPCSAAS